MSKRPKHGGLKTPEPLQDLDHTAATGLTDRSLLRSLAADPPTLEAAARKATSVRGKPVKAEEVGRQLEWIADFVQSADIKDDDA